MAVSDDLDAARAAYQKERNANAQRDADYESGRRYGEERGYERGVKAGIDKADNKVSIVGLCAVASVLLGLFGATMISSAISSRAIVEQTQAACTGDLTEPGRAVACALAARKTP
jgi:hypothetical protein